MLTTEIHKRLNQRGDTIVEVMIVLAVLGLAIGLAYATANRSLLIARQAQESAEASELVKAQVEQLRTYSEDTTDPAKKIFFDSPSDDPNTKFCVANGAIKTYNKPDGQLTDYTGYDPACVIGRYYLSAKYDKAADVFVVKAVWDDVRGDDQDSTTLVYRMHKQLP